MSESNLLPNEEACSFDDPTPAPDQTITTDTTSQEAPQTPALASADDRAQTDGAEEHEPQSTPPACDDAQVDDASAFDFSAAREHLLALQQELRALGIPVVILFEGWSAAGKGTMAGELLEGLDPRGYQVYVPERFGKDEDKYPDMRRYWTRMPAKGHISLFIGGWYHPQSNPSAQLERINLMEQMLVCDGVVMLKFFISISRKEQKRRLRKLESKKATRALVKKSDWTQNHHYDRWQAYYNHMLSATNDSGSVWHILRGHDKRASKQQMYEAVIAAFEQVIAQRKAGDASFDVPDLIDHKPLLTIPISPLKDFVPLQALHVDYKEALDEAQKKLRKLQYELYRRKIPTILAFEGWDAAGKGGSIRRLSSALDPRGFTVIPIASPTAEEKAHHHLWRFWKALPTMGNIAIFDRTWYGRVMVERIEGFCTEAQWKRAYEEMNLFEHELFSQGAIIRKFWLQIDSDEQLKRFIARRDNPEKQWKITDEDWRNRDKWAAYEEAVNDMLQKTNTLCAPWVVVEANNKQFARLKVINTVIAAIEDRLTQKS